MPAGRPMTYTNKQIEGKINKYFEYIDSTPLYRYEQRKGNIIIPKNFKGSINDIDSLIKIPLPKIYLEGELCDWLGFDKDWLNDTLTNLRTKIKQYSENKEQGEKESKEQKEKREKDIELLRILTHARNKCSNQKIQAASAGLANPIIVSRLEGLKEKTDITSNNETLPFISNIEIVSSKD